MIHAQTFKNKVGGHIEFTVLKDNDKTEVDNQYRSSTCWSFSSLSFFESEILRKNNKVVNLSEMFVVNHIYRDKADKYVRMHGNGTFAAGGAFHDALYVLEHYGMVPQQVYPGKYVDADNHIHWEMDYVLKGIVDAVIKNPNGKLSPVWKNAFNASVDAYLGKLPETFQADGVNHTPQSYAKSLGLNPADYVMISSFSHHPFYAPFVLEVPDNWAAQSCLNVPLNEFREILTYAIDRGYTVAWGADVSEKGFNWKNGVAIVPEKGWDAYEKGDIDSLTNHAIPQMKITQENRQEAFDNYETQDDHGMHITGMVKDQKGTIYYKVKNSWGTKSNDCDGYLYASESYVLYKTTNIMVHKDAIPAGIAKKLGLK
ncbi:MAG: C1 family peptidase [Bacteroidota bacterium]|nr:C1 family peptidase [Bacteroidota bacterium]MDX5430045.1 C1 family peptidase [Bacteroidota bacterium]MDX5468815.1 C1 family peptidase [Bacteroidota bacterium]